MMSKNPGKATGWGDEVSPLPTISVCLITSVPSGICQLILYQVYGESSRETYPTVSAILLGLGALIICYWALRKLYRFTKSLEGLSESQRAVRIDADSRRAAEQLYQNWLFRRLFTLVMRLFHRKEMKQAAAEGYEEGLALAREEIALRNFLQEWRQDQETLGDERLAREQLTRDLRRWAGGIPARETVVAETLAETNAEWQAWWRRRTETGKFIPDPDDLPPYLSL